MQLTALAEVLSLLRYWKWQKAGKGAGNKATRAWFVNMQIYVTKLAAILGSFEQCRRVNFSLPLSSPPFSSTFLLFLLVLLRAASD